MHACGKLSHKLVIVSSVVSDDRSGATGVLGQGVTLERA